MSERRVCRVLGQPRSTQSYVPRATRDEEALTGEIVKLASRFGRYGYRRITALLRQRGWHVNHKRVERGFVAKPPNRPDFCNRRGFCCKKGVMQALERLSP